MNETRGGNPDRTIYAATLAACVVIAAGAYLLVVDPMLAHADELTKLNEKMGDQETLFSDVSAQHTRLGEQHERVQRDLSAATTELESIARLNQRMAELTQLASAIGLSISAVEPGLVTPGRYFDTVSIRVKGHGTYRTFTRFSHAMLEAMPSVRISSFEMTASGTDGEGSAQFMLNLEWFALPGGTVSQR